MLLSAVSVLVVAQSSSEIPEGLMNNPALCSSTCFEQYYAHLQEDLIISIQHLVPDFLTVETSE